MSARAKMNRKAEALIAALRTERTQVLAAAKAGISEATAQRWLRDPRFQAAYRHARRLIVESAVGKLQRTASKAVDVGLGAGRGSWWKLRARSLPKFESLLQLDLEAGVLAMSGFDSLRVLKERMRTGNTGVCYPRDLPKPATFLAGNGRVCCTTVNERDVVGNPKRKSLLLPR